MQFWEWAKGIILEELRKKHTLDSIIEAIKSASAKGPVAFYPASKYTRTILNTMIDREPDLASCIYGCFDRSPAATSATGIPMHTLDRMKEVGDKLALLVVASSTYYSRQLRDIEEFTGYRGPVITTSHFDYSLPPHESPEALVQEIEDTLPLFADAKSRMIYITSWLSRVLNDEEITSLFESENPNPPIVDNTIEYQGLTISGVADPEISKELFSDVYRMKEVAPQAGDVLLDVGAFMGETAVMFASQVGGQGKVYAFEPIQTAFEQMQVNINTNNLQDIITPVNRGCGEKTTKALAVSADDAAPWTYIGDAEGSVEVELVSIDDFVKAYKVPKVDFIKMDVEGFEENVLMGAAGVIRTQRPRMAVAMYHKSDDLTNLPRVVRELNDYEMYVRSNMGGPYGLTLFCR